MKYLITGKNGQLGQEFIRRFDKDRTDYKAFDKETLNVTIPAQVNEMIASYRPTVIINCSAYNFVDKAEAETEKAFAVNGLGPKILAQSAHKYNALLIHYSTDYVFDGGKEDGEYSEKDPVNPLNCYGKSKLAGERSIQQETDRYLLFRVSWLYGKGKQNFIYKLRDWARSKEYLKIACDEFSVPTHTQTVVDLTLKSVDQGFTGLFHAISSGFCSRYEWAKLVFHMLGIRKFIRPVTGDLFQLRARRPHFSAMNNAMLSSVLNLQIPMWDQSMISFLREEI